MTQPIHPNPPPRSLDPSIPRSLPLRPFSLLLILAAALRLANLDNAPPGIHHDEASNGYDAYAILKTGADRWNHAWPVLLEGFGHNDHRGALYAYLIIPFQALLGPDHLTLATRLPAAMLGILSIAALYALVARTHNRHTALYATLFLTLSPWHLQLSRFGHESSLTPAVTVIALALLARAGFPFSNSRRTTPGDAYTPASAPPPDNQCSATPRGWRSPRPTPTLRPLPLIAATTTFALSLYTYPSMRLFTPVFLLAAAIHYRKTIAALLHIPRNRRAALAALLGAGAVATPMVSLAVTDFDKLAARTREVSLFHRADSIPGAVAQTARQYAAHIGPRWLFIEGDTYPIQSPPGLGQLSLALAPFLLLGIYIAFRDRRKNPVGPLLLVWLALYPIASAPTYIAEHTATHALRAACGLPVFQWLAAIGLHAVLARFATQPRRRTAAIIASTFTIAANGIFVVHDYFARWARDPWIAALYQRDLRDALRAIRPIHRDYDRIYVSDQVNGRNQWFAGETYVYPLLVLPIDPALFHEWPKDVRYEHPTDAFHRVDSFGPFTLTTRTDVLERSFQDDPDHRALFIARPREIRGGRLIQTITGANGEIAFEIVAVTPSPRPPRARSSPRR